MTRRTFPPPVARWARETLRKSALLSTFSRLLLTAVTAGLLLSGCDLIGGDFGPDRTFDFDFSSSTHQWEAFFTDYPVGWTDKMELTADHRPLPESVGASGNGLFIHGFNNSDDVKMLFRRRVTGLASNATYTVRFWIEFATKAPSNCPGIGGSPGEGVKVIASASRTKPKPVVIDDPDPYYHLNVQQQAEDDREWYEKAILGHIANSRGCEEKEVFELKQLASGDEHATLTTDENGAAWLLFGTRSGHEGRTSLYYTQVRVELRR